MRKNKIQATTDTTNLNSVNLILASQSPRRVELLKQMGISCLVKPADIDETPHVDEPPTQYVMRLAEQKATACLQLLPDEMRGFPILAADTTVVCAGKILGKPEDDADAAAMLQALSGREHHVYTAVALAYSGSIAVALSSTLVEMMALTPTQIAAYIATGEHLGKAGSYGIQGLASTWIKRIDGSYSGVMGLPMFETAQLLRTYGLMKF